MDNLAAEPAPVDSVDRTVPAGIAMPVKKGGKGAVVLAILFALIAAGLGVWLAIVLLNPAKGSEPTGGNSGSSSQGNNSQSNDSDSNTVVYDRDENVVLNLVDEIEESFIAFGSERFYSDENLPIKVNDKLWAASVMTYGSRITKYADADGSAEDLRNNAVSVLKKHGMTNITVPPLYYGDEKDNTTDYFKNNDGLYCHVSDISKVEGTSKSNTYSWFEFGCTNENWLTEDSKSLAIALATAYNNSEEGKNYPISFIGVTPRRIKKSKSGAYETITASLADSAALFYRKVGGDWKLFTTTQQQLSCSAYKTAELKEAYEGERCYEDGTAGSTAGKESTVKR